MKQNSAQHANSKGKSPFARARWTQSPGVARVLAIFYALLVPAAVLLHYSRFELPWVAAIVAALIFAGVAVWEWSRATEMDRKKSLR